MTFHAPADISFGEWLRQRRRELDLTREQLARQVGCSAITLRKLEGEERRPSPAMTERLAQVLRIAPDARGAFQAFARGNPFAAQAAPPAATGPRQNLPAQLTRFIGREDALAEITRLLATARLVTLTGPGGSGKTRLAQQAAGERPDRYPDGAGWVELAPLADPALLPQALAAALGVKDRQGQPLAERLAEYLRPKQVLLVLDNCEHLIHACAALADGLLRACPRLTILATSRESLAVAGERVYQVPTLALPDAQATDPADIAGSEAVQLFRDRARAALPNFELNAGNAIAIGQICRRLDGIPLAIELAASRVKLLRVQQILQRLDDRFGLLISGSRAALPRHQTLQGLIDWSYDLLTEPEARLLRRLAVFAGGWTLEAAEAVCAGDDLPASRVLDLLTLLVDKSLVIAARQPGRETRYSMLETIRQYAWSRLEAGGELAATRWQHARYFHVLLKSWVPNFHAAGHPSSVDQFDANLDNLRAASAWLLACGDTEIGPWQALNFNQILFNRGSWTEARTRLESTLLLTGRPELARSEVHTSALAGLGTIAMYQGDYAVGEHFLTEALRRFEEDGYVRQGGHLLLYLGRIQREQGHPEAARRLLLQALARLKTAGDVSFTINALNTLTGVAVLEEDAAQALATIEESLALNKEAGIGEWGAWSLNHMGHIALLQGDYARAVQLQTQCVAEFRQLGLQLGLTWGLHGLGESALALDDGEAAQANFSAGLTNFRDLGDWAGVAWCLAGLAGVAALDEDPERAAQLWGAAEALRQSVGVRQAPAARATRERLQAAAREQLGAAAYAAAFAAGQALPREATLALALPEAGLASGDEDHFRKN